MTIWITNQDGVTANNWNESRMISAIPVGDTVIPCPPLTATQLQEQLKEYAQFVLNKVTGPSGTIIRCVAAGIIVPLEWSNYVKALRAISNGSDTISTTLPTQPAYPAGT